MAEFNHPVGYHCEFKDSVQDNFYCKKCTLVARRLTFTSCCGESYCHGCIADIQQQVKPCPECGEKNFTTIKPLKYQRQMDCLKVHCSMKERGCDWTGMLGQLDVHMDPDQNNCEFMDIKCPFNCQQTIPKNKIEQHVALECVKRNYVCQYCDFKASYEVMVDTHWPHCTYFPLQCPNFCGVTCERDVMGDHMRMCRLEEVACEFNRVGCDERFRREDQEEHCRQNNHKHLTMTAAAALKMNQQLQQKQQEDEEKLEEQEKRFQELEVKFKNKFEDQKKTFQEQERKFQEEKQKTEMELQQQEQKFEKKFEEQELKFHKLLQERDKKFVELQEKLYQNEIAVKEVTNFISLKRTFVMENFSKEKEKDKPGDWNSPAMYTHMCGYKFCISIDANGSGSTRGKAMVVNLWAMKGEYDHQLKWPAQASFTIELLNQHGGENIIRTITKCEWHKPKTIYEFKYSFGCAMSGMHWVFLEHSKLKTFLDDDTLYFHLSNIETTLIPHTTVAHFILLCFVSIKLGW